ncbi:MAG: hypothetical protein IPJ75_18520 [Ignavibacteriales bacterium]|nr:hypothetical protein [Ignavibacteriales bacterium]
MIEVGDYKKTGNKFVHKINKVDAVIAYDLYGREVLSNRDGGLKNENLFDKQGRWSQNRYSYIFEREQLYSITDITFKNDLMQKITEKYPNIYAFGDTQIRSSIETVVKYETGFVTKK